MIIAIDFDGTIVKNEFPRIGPLISTAVATIRRLHSDGHRIIINTCRNGEQALAAVNFLVANNVPFDVFNDNDPVNVKQYGSNSRKIYAHCYIDDCNVGGLPSWSDIYDWITAREQEWIEKTKK